MFKSKNDKIYNNSKRTDLKAEVKQRKLSNEEERKFESVSVSPSEKGDIDNARVESRSLLIPSEIGLDDKDENSFSSSRVRDFNARVCYLKEINK